MKYRLALKIDNPTFINARGKLSGSHGAIGWAVLALTEKVKTGTAKMDKYKLPNKDQLEEVCVISYESPQDMIEPMSPAQFELRLEALIAELPPGVTVRRVPFNKAKYLSWLGARLDSLELRAKWAGHSK